MCHNLRWSASIERAMDHDQGIEDDPAETESGSVAPDEEWSSASKFASEDAGDAAPQDGPPQASFVPDAPTVSPGDLPAHGVAGLGGWIAHGSIDRRSVLAAVFGGLAYLALSCLSLLLSSAGDSISPVWLPNAAAVAFLLRSRISNELPFLLAALAANLAANAVADLPGHVALVFALAKIAEVIAVLALTRTSARPHPDMSRLADLARFVWAGGLMGPLLSAVLVAPVMGSTTAQMLAGLLQWFLTDSMAMILIVPPAL
jgi:hypothetical protein